MYIYFIFQLEGYQDLLHFEAAGNILQAAFLFIWERAAFLESIRISGEIVNPASGIFLFLRTRMAVLRTTFLFYIRYLSIFILFMNFSLQFLNGFFAPFQACFIL